MQKIGETGDGKSAVATPDGKSRKNKKKIIIAIIISISIIILFNMYQISAIVCSHSNNHVFVSVC